MSATAEARAPAAPPLGTVAHYRPLLLAIVSAFAVEGIAEPGRWEQVLLTVLLGVTLLLSLDAAQVQPRRERIAQVVVVALVLLSVIEALTGHREGRATLIATGFLSVLAPPAIAIGVVRRLRDTGAVSIDAVIGVLCVYVLVGMFFSFVYGTIGHFNHGSFFASGEPVTSANCMYFSFTTLTTIGYGDLTAASNLGHTLSVSEGLLGQVYLVTVVSLIVSNLGRRRPLAAADAAVAAGASTPAPVVQGASQPEEG